VSVTGFGDGTAGGARYSTVPAVAVLTTWHGLDATTQICPTAVLPPGIPETCQITFAFGLPETEAVNGCRCPTAALALDGVKFSAALLVSVTLAIPAALGFAALTAWTMTVVGEGNADGAVYVVTFAPEIFVTVPMVAFPPTMPFTSQVTLVFADPVTCAVNCCVDESATLADPGVTTTLTCALIVTFIDAALVGSAAGVAATVITDGDGAVTGA
jgi:hypothetical protein